MNEAKKFHQKVYCRRCKTNTNHIIITKHSIGEDDGYYFWAENYIIGQCMGCDTPTFIKEYDDRSMHYTAYDDVNDEHIEINETYIKVYPPEPTNKSSEIYNIIEFKHLPELLQTLYQQVVANLELKHYLLAAAGLRMIIEGICNDLGIKKGNIIDDDTGNIMLDKNGNQIRSTNLNGKINGLVENNILTEGQTAILHIIRKLGNQTVHKLNNPKKKIIIEGLEIVEQTFKNIYELKKYDKLAQQLKHNKTETSS